MPRDTSHDRLRMDLMEALGPTIAQFNANLHQQVKEIVRAINENYLLERNAALVDDGEGRFPIGLFISYESVIETHTQLESGYIRWRYGKFKVNKSRRAAGAHPLTSRVRKHSRNQLHYSMSDFATIPSWHRAPSWEHRLVMYTEKKVRPVREVLHAHKEAQRRFLHAPQVPLIDTSFDDLVL